MVMSVPFCFPSVPNLCFVPGGYLSLFPRLVPFQNPAKALLLALTQEEFRRMNRHEGPKTAAPFPRLPAVICPLPSKSYPRMVGSARVTFSRPMDSSPGSQAWMRKAGWPCLSAGTPCAESRNSSPMTPELQGPGLRSAPWDWPPGGSRAAVVTGSAAGSGLWEGSTLQGAGRAQMKEAGPKLCCGCVRVYVSPGGSISPSITGSAWSALESPGFAVLQPIPDKPCLVP